MHPKTGTGLWRLEDDLKNAIFLSGIDDGRLYETDLTEIWYRDSEYLLVTASGCSCWEGDYEVEAYPSLDELEASLRHNERKYGNPSQKNVDYLVSIARERNVGE